MNNGRLTPYASRFPFASCQRVKRSFSLIELLTVISILATVAGSVVTSYGDFSEGAELTATKSKLQQIRQAILQFKKDTGSFPKQGRFGAKGLDKNSASDDLFTPDLAKLKIAVLKSQSSSNGARKLLTGSLNNKKNQNFRLLWHSSIANFTQLFQEPHTVKDDGTKDKKVMPWKIRYKRGWNGPYLRKDQFSLCTISIKAHDNDADSFLDKSWNPSSNNAAHTSFDIPAISDSFNHKSVKVAYAKTAGQANYDLVYFEWRSRFMNSSDSKTNDPRAYISKNGRPILLAKLDSDEQNFNCGHYLISFGPNGAFDYGQGDDILLAMPEMD